MEFIDLTPTHKLDGVILSGYLNEPIEVTICLTGHHLILMSRQENVKELCVSINTISNNFRLKYNKFGL